MTNATAPKRRLRFSLLNVMFAMAIASLVVALVASARRNADLLTVNGRLADENLRHRNELGIFDVADDAQIHAIRVPTEDGEPRRYRVYLPPGRTYELHYSGSDIPAKGVPTARDSSELASGHYLIGLKLTRMTDRKTGEPIPYGHVDLDVISTDGAPNGSSRHFGILIGESKNDWLLNKATGGMSYTWQEIGRELQVFGAAETVVLYRARAKQIPEDCDGFIVWVTSNPETRAE